ncbi:MAG: hypothetical protein ACRD38_00850 [Nitrososphaerales archaeon]
MQEKVHVNSTLELLDKLIDNLVPFDLSKFISFRGAYVYSEPIRCANQIIYRGDEYVDFDTEAIVHLNLPEQLSLYQRIADKQGIKARHGTMKESLEAAWSDETKEFKEKVLRYWLYNGEVIRKLGKAFDISRVVGMEYREVKSVDAVCERDGKLLETEGVSMSLVPVIKLGPTLQTEIPTTSGFYSEFSGVIPVDKELGDRTEKTRGDWGRIYFDKTGLSAVGSLWDSGVGTFGTYAYEPLRGIRDTGIGLWSDENPKR